MKSVAYDALIRARMLLHHRAPYMMGMVYSFIPVEVLGYPTMGVTKGLVLYYNPAWIMTLPDTEIAALLVHEAFHAMRDHVSRIECFGDRSLANIAADLAINPHVVETSFTLPAKGCFPGTPRFPFPKDNTLENYYSFLQKNPPPPQKGASLAPPMPGDGCCGGIAGNPGDPELERELDAQHGKTPVEVEVSRLSAIEHMKQHFASEGRGKTPSWANDLIKSLAEKPVIPWKRVLSRVIRSVVGSMVSGGSDYSLSNPSKRSYARGIPRPGMVDYTPEVAFVLDTSGSMSRGNISECLREAAGVLQALGLRDAWMLQADTSVKEDPVKVSLRDLRGDFEIVGRGGTDFDDALQKVSQLRPRPNLVIYLTDGDGGVTVKPKIPLIWCLITHRRKPPCPWGFPVYITPTR